MKFDFYEISLMKSLLTDKTDPDNFTVGEWYEDKKMEFDLKHVVFFWEGAKKYL